MSQFVAETLQTALGALVDRRRKVQQFIDEGAELDRAIREQHKLLKRLGIGTVRAVEAPRTGAAKPTAAPREGTNAERALKLLRDHPRGLNTSVVMREAGIAQGSVNPVLQGLVDSGAAIKVGRGFWRIAEGGADAAAVG